MRIKKFGQVFDIFKWSIKGLTGKIENYIVQNM